MGGFVRSTVELWWWGLLRVIRPLAACRTEAECSPRTGEMVTSLEEVIRKKMKPPLSSPWLPASCDPNHSPVLTL